MTGPRFWLAAAAITILGLFASRFHLAAVRLYDPDEFEHAHVSLEIAKGGVPYRDFFEHHGPLPYYGAAVLPALFGNKTELLIWNRIPSLCFSAVMLASVFLQAKRLFGVAAGMAACLWLETMPWHLEKSIEWRPDVPAACFLTLAASRLMRSEFRRKDGFIVGTLFGAASLCTLKSATIALWLALAFCIDRFTSKQSWFRELALGFVGGVLVWTPFFGYFAFHGALWAFVESVLVLPFQWEASESLRNVLTSFKTWAPGHVALGLWALGRSLIQGGMYGHWRLRGTTLAFAVTAHLLMLPLAPATFLQYYLLVLPMAAVVVGINLADALHAMRSSPRPLATRLSFAMPIAAVVGGMFAFSQQENWRPLTAASNLPYLLDFARYQERSQVFHWVATWDCLFLMLSLSGVAWLVIRPGRFAVLMAACMLLPGWLRIGMQHRLWSKDTQMRDLACVRALIGPDGVVLDGFTGLGWQNPHAFFYWWINPHTEWLIRKRGDLDALRECIVHGKPDLIVFDKVWNHDQRMRKLYDVIIEPVGANYRPTAFQPDGFWCMLLLRNDLPDRSAESN